MFLGSWTAGYAGWPASTWIWVSLVAMAAGIPFLLRGTGLSVKAAFLLYLSEGAALLILSAVVLVSAHGAISVPLHAVGGPPGGFAGIGGLTFALAVFAYVGWENSAPMGEKSRDPHRTIPRTVVLSIVVSMAILFIAAWALAAGFAGWKGAAAGMRALTASTANPFLVLASHYAPWLHLIMFLIGITSCLSCFLAAGLPATRYFRRTGDPLIHVRHEWDVPDALFMRPGTPGAEIHPLVAPGPGEPVITKDTPNSFLRTPLLARLREMSVTDLVVAGMMTSMCIDATVRAAADLGLNVTVVHDACAAPDLEFSGAKVPAAAVHAAFLAALADGYADVVGSEVLTSG